MENGIGELSASQGRCTPGPIGVCHLGRLGVGESATVDLVLPVVPAGISQLGAQVTVNADPLDPQPDNDMARLEVAVAR